MQGELVRRFCLYVFLHIWASGLCLEARKTVWFQPGTAYTYKYEGTTYLKCLAHIIVSTKVTIVPMWAGNDSQRCRFTVNAYNIRVAQQEMQHYKQRMPKIDFSKRMLFDMSGSGEIQRLYYPEDEDAVALTLKKILLGTLSSRLVVSESQRTAGARWSYRVNETGHEGVHTAVYHARPLDGDEGIVFTKIRQTKALVNVDQGQTKIVHLNTTLGVPVKIAVKESFHSPNELAPSYRPTIPEATEALKKGNAELNLPKMGGTSTAVMTFVKAELLHSVRQNEEDSIWSGMRNSSLKVEPIPPSKVNLTSIEGAIEGNISCIIKAHAGDIHTGLPSFRDLAIMLIRLGQEDIDKLTQRYLKEKQPEVARQTMIDALGTAHTSDCYAVMMRHVFLVKRPEAELLMRALFQLVELSTPAPEV